MFRRGALYLCASPNCAPNILTASVVAPPWSSIGSRNHAMQGTYVGRWVESVVPSRIARLSSEEGPKTTVEDKLELSQIFFRKIPLPRYGVSIS